MICLKKYNDISIYWYKSLIVLKKNLIANPSKIKYFWKLKYDAKTIPEAGLNHICWLVILVDSVLKKHKNYYSQVLLKEFKYIEKEKKQ